MSKTKRIILLLSGPVLFLLCTLLLPKSLFEGVAAREAVGVTVWMAFWWITGPVDYAVTAFLPIVMNAILNMANMSSVIANYASETILLLLGASILSASWEKTGLDRRIASKFLSLMGTDFRAQLISWFVLSAAMSAVLPNAVVCAALTPIAVSMLNFAGEGDLKDGGKGAKLLLYIAYGTGVGGLFSPLGGAMNLVTVDYIQQVTGCEYMYIKWVICFLPIIAVLMVSNIIFMLRDVPRKSTLGQSREYFMEEYRKMPKMTGVEKCSLWLFMIAALLAFTRQLYAGWLPGLKPAYVFLLAAMVSFLVSKPNGERLMKWKETQGRIGWELMYIFAGGLALGTLMNDTGAAKAFGSALSRITLDGGILSVFLLVLIPLLLSDFTSNTATAAIIMPIVVSLAQGNGQNPIPYIYIASIGVNLSYMMPTSIRAIPVGYGLSPRYMLREGWKMTVMVVILMTLTVWLMLKGWQPLINV